MASAQYFEQYAIDCVNQCEMHDGNMACEIVLQQIDLFGYVTCLQVRLFAFLSLSLYLWRTRWRWQPMLVINYLLLRLVVSKQSRMCGMTRLTPIDLRVWVDSRRRSVSRHWDFLAPCSSVIERESWVVVGLLFELVVFTRYLLFSCLDVQGHDASAVVRDAPGDVDAQILSA